MRFQTVIHILGFLFLAIVSSQPVCFVFQQWWTTSPHAHPREMGVFTLLTDPLTSGFIRCRAIDFLSSQKPVGSQDDYCRSQQS